MTNEYIWGLIDFVSPYPCPLQLGPIDDGVWASHIVGPIMRFISIDLMKANHF